jgi:hypothetical protein
MRLSPWLAISRKLAFSGSANCTKNPTAARRDNLRDTLSVLEQRRSNLSRPGFPRPDAPRRNP